MHIHIVKNKYLNALFVLMLLSAIIHVAILFFIAAATKNISLLNYFNIVQISYFIPSFNNAVGDIVSVVFVLVLYEAILVLNDKKE